MRLMRVGVLGAERPVVLDDGGRAFDLSGLTNDIDGAFLADDGIARARAALAAGALPAADVAGERVGAPIARPPAVVCVGMNYAAHAAESGAAPPEHPVIFYKHPNTVVGPNDDVILPRGAAKVDWEVELGIVIGRRARYLSSPEDAFGYIAGYVLSNDVSERALQLEVSGGQWSKGKSCETFNPLGPWLVPAADVGNPQALGLRSWVNGEVRQDSNTADMLFGVATLIHDISQYTVLEPGDLVNTGTPQGVALSGRFPYLSIDDVVEIEIDGLGRQRQVVVKG
ncbi:fumarylacetoacetate hydrolase family protein [Actinophytocola algeriensis]|uniref:2-keto-4-pentenoate hydratase/2-oxohepta-3-ene-1,7-dioic acid hydratase in catechol pathway n=1 Tax=Actinophytocola algeriensis TaxID=1768010 RepID=A0A7W7VF73_9PSEU|nr:fumarylacetoacetate hydrolase family protein [Actinophytocola algeriensis]MBB4907710.1 2-keto-4-pentenoate hydratase/2-oxohepta-3-ene-1,7-dioic acid hydratase in catechol pathway [Actinophytocola algeriensis]MBE1479740.1 2-keto-4-pentenoate hydratase/2-oxohepta-3-ene-1,7-dioic acid hydratase in catechol pathway [Actinophytocola algeriensis]